MSSPRATAVVATLLAVAACDRCGHASDPTPVPFKLGAAAPPATPTEEAATPPQAVTFDPPTATALVDGVAVTAPTGMLVAAVPLDLDHDGDSDVLFVAREDTGSARLYRAERGDQGVTSPRAVFDLDERADCQVVRASLHPLSRALVAVQSEHACAHAPTEHRMVLVSAEREPRVRERFALHPAPAGDPHRLSLRLAAEDTDADGVPDVLAHLTITSAGSTTPTEVTLRWLDRPSGLDRDPAEPEATLARLADAAASALAAQPAAAGASAEAAIALHRLLCTEPGLSRVSVGTSVGVACGHSAGATRATAIRALAEAQLGHDRAAVDLLTELEAPWTDPAAAEAVWRQARDTGATDETWAAHVGPALPADAAHSLVPIALLDDTTLRVGGSLYHLDLQLGTVTPADPASVPSTTLPLDPTGTWYVSTPAADCRGHHAAIFAAEDLARSEPGPVISRPLLVPARMPCDRTRTPTPTAPPTPTLSVVFLGWAPQGIVAAQATRVFVAPMSRTAQPAGPPEALAANQLAPAPLPHGAATPDGREHVFATPFGIARHELATDQLTLIRPRGLRTTGPLHHAVVAPSGGVFAVVAGERVVVIARAAPR